ncbi:ribbon-helix-helix domain-containing protein [Flaviflagellibacter deserti]|uniref:Ribbon-helix-helix domain-containing protein n=1 Tax=Flaviflagellibacter deserti TaxID=2267266 RepID=A0ABV9Z691_9HYPH
MSGVRKRSIEIAGHRTSITLEDDFWTALQEIGHRREVTLRALVAEIDGNRGENNLSSAIRLYVLRYYRDEAAGAAR